jgi:microcystin-dependent protein
MYRTDAPGHVANMFTDGNPATSTPATTVDDDFLNEVQEELVNVVLAAGIALNKGTRTQVRDAIQLLIGAATNPLGTVRMWAGNSGNIDAGWQLCNGLAISRTTFAALFAKIGTTWGAGDGTTTFNLPDLRDRFIVGAGNTYAQAVKAGADAAVPTMQTGGAHDHGGISGATALTEAQMPAHDHEITHSHTLTGESGSTGHFLSKGTGSYINGTTQFDTTVKGSGAAHDHTITSHAGHTHTMNSFDRRPAYVGILFIIRTG